MRVVIPLASVNNDDFFKVLENVFSEKYTLGPKSLRKGSSSLLW